MRIFVNAIKEVRTSLIKVFLFEEALNAILVFLGIYIISTLFRLTFLLPFAAASAYFVFAMYREFRINPEKLVESKYEGLQEELSTAAEYSNIENPVTNELKTDVLKKLKNVEESSFCNERRVYAKSITVIVLCFIIIVISPFSISFFKATFPTIFDGGDEANKVISDFVVSDERGEGDNPLAVRTSDSEIYGNPTVAKLGTEELKVIFRPAGTELSTSNVNPVEDLQFAQYYPEEVVTVAAESMEERIPKEQQELVRRYFRNVVESGR
jgi:hypothetical protein